MKGILHKIDYEGDWETFLLIAQKSIKTGGALLYLMDEKRGVIIEPDCTVVTRVSIPSLEVITH